jgi:bacterioferritin-associated ferredoxin
MSEVYACLGCSDQCGRCAHTIKRITDERPGSVHANASMH